MPINIGNHEIDNLYVGSDNVVKAYLGSDQIYNKINTITGGLPLSFMSYAQQALKNYRIFGTASGSGMQTVNWFNPLTSVTPSRRLNQDGTTAAASGCLTTDFVPVNGRVFTLSKVSGTTASICCYDSDKNWVQGQQYQTGGSDVPGNVTIECDEDISYVRFCYYNATTPKGSIMLINGTEAPASFIPYGYQILLTVTSGQNTDIYTIYIGSTKLGTDEYVDYTSEKIYKMIEGILTPINPPVTLPAITAYQNINTIRSPETVGYVSVIGYINSMTAPAWFTPEWYAAASTYLDNAFTFKPSNLYMDLIYDYYRLSDDKHVHGITRIYWWNNPAPDEPINIFVDPTYISNNNYWWCAETDTSANDYWYPGSYYEDEGSWTEKEAPHSVQITKLPLIEYAYYIDYDPVRAPALFYAGGNVTADINYL